VVDLANGLDSSRFEKHLAFFEPMADLLDRVDGASVHVHRLARRHKLDLSLVRQLAQLLERHEIEVVHCTLQISLFFAVLARLRARTRAKLVAAIHTTVNQSLRAELYDRLLYRRLLRRCDRIQFVCHAQAEHWSGKYPEIAPRAAVVYNGVDAARYDPAASITSGAELRRKLGLAPGAFVMSSISGLRPEKGHAFLLDALARLPAEASLLLAGDGPERPRIEARAAHLGVQERVVFLGEVADVRPVISASDVTVLASTAVETFSMAMLESMALGVPVVATRVGGLDEAITPGVTGDLVPPGDAEALRLSLQRMLADESGRRRMGQQARTRVSTQFSQHAMAEATAALLSEVLTDRVAVGRAGPVHD
jgi:glycosyltransferase involved in cell wall biosynthesis